MKRVYELIVTNQKGESLVISDLYGRWLTKKIARSIIDRLPDGYWYIIVKGDSRVVCGRFCKSGNAWQKLEKQKEEFNVIL